MRDAARTPCREPETRNVVSGMRIAVLGVAKGRHRSVMAGLTRHRRYRGNALLR
jgi:hypothetical protein